MVWILLVNDSIPEDGVHNDMSGLIDAIIRRIPSQYEASLRQEIPTMPNGHRFEVDVQGKWIKFQIFQRETS